MGRAASRTPVDPDVDPLHTTYTSNSVYYYSADKLSKVDSWADIKMNGDYNYAFYTAGVANNMGTIDLRSKADVASGSANLGYGNVGIYSTNYSAGSFYKLDGTITTGMSDLLNEEYSIGMAAGHYNKKTKEITRRSCSKQRYHKRTGRKRYRNVCGRFKLQGGKLWRYQPYRKQLHRNVP